jgi:hypothetical protein
MNRQHDTLVILGSHPTTREEFDWDRVRECDIWAFNEAVSIGSWIQHVTGVFQMHIPAIWRNPANRNDNNHAAWLVGGETPPVFMQERYPEVPQAVEYPLEAIIHALLPGFQKPASQVWNNRDGFFTNSVDYALALGIYLDYPRIEIYGCEMGLNTEYVYQRPGFCFWIGLALGRGIVVDYHGSVFDVPLYGYEGDILLARSLFENRVMELRHYCQEATIAYDRRKEEMSAAIEALVKKEVKPEVVMGYVVDVVKASQVFAMNNGALQENERYLEKIAKMEGASGDFRISRTEFEQAANEYKRKRTQAMEAANLHAGAVQKAFNAIDKAEGYKKRTAAADKFQEAIAQQINVGSQAAGYDAAGAENMRYMRILDEKLKAAGGAKSLEVLENLN